MEVESLGAEADEGNVGAVGVLSTSMGVLLLGLGVTDPDRSRDRERCQTNRGRNSLERNALTARKRPCEQGPHV